jgi:hypothetical protein
MLIIMIFMVILGLFSGGLNLFLYLEGHGDKHLILGFLSLFASGVLATMIGV